MVIREQVWAIGGPAYSLGSDKGNGIMAMVVPEPPTSQAVADSCDCIKTHHKHQCLTITPAKHICNR